MTGIDSNQLEVSNNCPICLEDINTNKIWKCKQCKSIFNKKCIITWTKESPHSPEYFNCPVCRLQYNNKCYYWYKFIKYNPNWFIYTYVCASVLIVFIVFGGLFLNSILILNYLTLN